MSTDRKYEFTGETREVAGRTLRRIRAVRAFGHVRAGTIGGWIEAESNLSHAGNCWVHNAACVCDSARVCDNAQVYDTTLVYGNAQVCDSALAHSSANIGGDAVCTIDPVVITGLRYVVTITDKHMQIGCKQYTASKLKKLLPTLIKQYKLNKLERDYLELIIRMFCNRLKSLKKIKK